MQEFTLVTTAVVGCRFRLDAPPPDPTLVDVRLDGTSLVYDVREMDGWDWATDEHREIRKSLPDTKAKSTRWPSFPMAVTLFPEVTTRPCACGTWRAARRRPSSST